MAPTTGLDGEKDPPGTPQVLDQLQRFVNTHLVSPFRNILLNTPPSERITTTSQNMNPTPLNPVMVDTVTPSLDDHEKVVFVADDATVSVSLISRRTDTQDKDPLLTPDQPLPPSPPASPPATLNANIISEQTIVSGTSSDILSVLWRFSRDPEGNRPTIDRHTIVVVAATLSTHLQEPTNSIAGSIERQVE